MSGTRSPSPKAPATEGPPAALIVAHGQPSDPAPAERALRLLADRVAGHLPGWDVASATMAAPGALDAAVAQARTVPLVYPLFMSDGWFTRTALPARLGSSAPCFLPPLGLDPALPPLAARRLAAKAARCGWHLPEVEIIVAAHGAVGSPNPARRTEIFARKLAALMPFRRVSTGFLEQAPRLPAAAAVSGARAICLPFFAAGGCHVTGDLPEELAMGGYRGLTLPPIGAWPEIAGLISQSCLRHFGKEAAA